MRQNRLENFIDTHREAFDSEIPHLRVWSEIDRELGSKKTKSFRLKKVLSVAASLALLPFAGYLISQFSPSQPDAPPERTAIALIAPEFPELEEYYNQKIRKKYRQLVSYEYDRSINSDLQAIDQTMLELKQELLKAPKGKEKQIIDDLIKSYKMKIKILERVLQRFGSEEPSRQNIYEDEMVIL